MPRCLLTHTTLMTVLLLLDACGDSPDTPPVDASVPDAPPPDAWPLEEQNGCWAIRSLHVYDQGVSWPSLALDGDGAAHIVDLNGSDKREILSYITNRSGDWQEQVLYETDDFSTSLEYPAIGTAEDGTVHVVVHLESGGEPPGVHMILSNGTLQQRPIGAPDAIGRIAKGPWVVVEPSGVIHALLIARDAFDNRLDEQLTYFRFDGTEWTQSVIASHPDRLGDAAIALGPDGVPRVSYFLAGSLYVATLAEDAWTSTLVAEEAGFNSIAIDAEGHTHVVYNAPEGILSGQRLFYATDASGTWVGEEVHNADWTTNRFDIAVSDTGLVHIVFERDGSLVHGVREGGAWRLDTIHQWGLHPSLVLDAEGSPHVAWSDIFIRAVRYATCN